MSDKDRHNPMPRLRERLHDLEHDGPGLGWESFSQYRRKRRLAVWWYAAAISLALIMVLALYSGFRKTASHQFPRSGKQPLQSEAGTSPRVVQKPQVKREAIRKPRLVPAAATTESDTAAIGRKTDVLPVEPDSPTAELLLPDLPLRPIAGWPVMAMPPRYQPVFLSIAQQPVNRNDSWQWHWGIGTGAGLFRPLTITTPAGSAFIHRDYAALRRKFEAGLYSQAFRLQTAAFKGDWMFSAGIGIQRQAVQANYDFVYSEAPVIDRDGRIVAYASSIPRRVAFASTHYIALAELPVSLAYRWKRTRDLQWYIRLGATQSFLGSIRGILPDPVLLDRQEMLSPVNYRSGSRSLQIALPVLLQTGKRSRFELSPEWRWHSGLRQAQGHYLSRFNQAGITCSYYVRF